MSGAKERFEPCKLCGALPDVNNHGRWVEMNCDCQGDDDEVLIYKDHFITPEEMATWNVRTGKFSYVVEQKVNEVSIWTTCLA